MVLDDSGGKIGFGTASLSKDEGGTLNSFWQLIPTNRDFFYRIRSFHGVVLDDYGGACGKNSASLRKDDGGS